jgi:hypothetical protein
LGLQRTAGNRAVARALNRRSRFSSRHLARYEAGEHSLFYDNDDEVQFKGIKVRRGNLIAMGDYYENVEALTAAPVGEFTALSKLIDLDRRARLTGGTPISENQWQAATAGRPEGQRYMDLNKRNFAHFARAASGPGATKDNRGEWERCHRLALQMAHEHANSDKKVPDLAIVVNLFGAHFLTDAFSAGHLINKTEIMSLARRAWDRMTTTGLYFKENAFTRGLAARVLADPGVSAKLAGYQLDLVKKGPITVQRFSELLWQFAKREPDTFFNLFARIVHDRLNRDIAIGKGILVENDANPGKPWRLSGDETLVKSPETRDMARAAVKASEDNLRTAANDAADPDYDALIKRVWDYVPRATNSAPAGDTSGAEQVRVIVDEYTNPANASVIADVSALSIKEIDTGIEELVKKKVLIPPAPPTPAPAPGVSPLPPAPPIPGPQRSL